MSSFNSLLDIRFTLYIEATPPLTHKNQATDVQEFMYVRHVCPSHLNNSHLILFLPIIKHVVCHAEASGL